MKLLYLSLHPPLDPLQVATGNQVRAAGICTALENAGHTVEMIAPQAENQKEPKEGFYRSKQALEKVIADSDADALIVGYWILLPHLPKLSIPVIVDFIAPRLLEAMYQEPGELLKESQHILSLLPVADHFLVGNQRQSDLLLTLLLLSGFDCKEKAPISIVPISITGQAEGFKKPETSIKIISAGVDWPWRQSQEYIKEVVGYCETHEGFSFQSINGNYPDSERAAIKSGLLSYEEMGRLFQDSHIGLELGKRNTEREFSHSFRLIEYLQCGLPVIVNAWLPIAAQVKKYNAGWLIEGPEEIVPLLQSLANDPGMLDQKAAGVERLVNMALNYTVTCKPLLEYLQNPVIPHREQKVPQGQSFFSRKNSLTDQQNTLSVIESSNREEVEKLNSTNSVVSKLKAALSQLYKILFCQKRSDRTPDILVVTRSDLFPVDHGAAVKIIRTAEALSRQGRDVYLCTDDRKEYMCFHEGKMKTYRYPFLLRLLSLPRSVGLVRLLLKGYPMSNAFLYYPVTDASYILRTLYLATKFPIGAYLAEFPAYVRPCRFGRSLFGGKILLVEHNVEYERLKEQIKNLSAKGYTQLKQLELHMCKLSDAVITVSDNDQEILVKDGVEPGKIHTIPHGVDVDGFKNNQLIDVRKKYQIPEQDTLLVYHGTYSYHPNLQAMEVMADEILPRLKKLGVSVSVLAIGSKPPAFPLHSNIYFTGSVEDLTTVIPAADMAVVTLQEGGGTRMKILDYFAAGIPVISTSKGIEGIPVKHGEEALIVDDNDAICEAILELINNQEKAQYLVNSAGKFVEKLSWDAIAERYLPLLRP